MSKQPTLAPPATPLQRGFDRALGTTKPPSMRNIGELSYSKTLKSPKQPKFSAAPSRSRHKPPSVKGL